MFGIRVQNALGEDILSLATAMIGGHWTNRKNKLYLRIRNSASHFAFYILLLTRMNKNSQVLTLSCSKLFLLRRNGTTKQAVLSSLTTFNRRVENITRSSRVSDRIGYLLRKLRKTVRRATFILISCRSRTVVISTLHLVVRHYPSNITQSPTAVPRGTDGRRSVLIPSPRPR